MVLQKLIEWEEKGEWKQGKILKISFPKYM
jgi:hypothetical protein